MISCRNLRYTYGGMYHESFFDATSSCGSGWPSSRPLCFWGLAEACSLCLYEACARNGARWQVFVLFLRWLSCRVGWSLLRSPRPAGSPAIFEMHVIEELKLNFELFPLLGCVQSRGSFPWHSSGQTQEHQADSPLSR